MKKEYLKETEAEEAKEEIKVVVDVKRSSQKEEVENEYM